MNEIKKESQIAGKGHNEILEIVNPLKETQSAISSSRLTCLKMVARATTFCDTVIAASVLLIEKVQLRWCCLAFHSEQKSPLTVWSCRFDKCNTLVFISCRLLCARAVGS